MIVRDRLAPRPVRELWPLAAVAVVVMMLAGFGVVPVWSGLPHMVGLPPLDLYTDLRILLTTTTSWPAFGLLLAAVFCLRVVVLAQLLGGLSRPRVKLAIALYAAVLLPLAIAAQLAYAGFAVLYTRFFWPAVAAAAIVVLLVAAVPWQGSTRLRTAFHQSWRDGLRAGPVLGYLVAVTLLGAVAEAWPAMTIALVPVSALLTAVTIRMLTRPAWRGSSLRLAAVGLAVVLAGTAFVVLTRDDAEVRPPAVPREGTLLLMSGINSSTGNGAVFRIDPQVFGYSCDHTYYYSYAGPGDGTDADVAACPVRTGAPFRRHHTHRPMRELADELPAQVGDLPRPLVVVAHSHSAWVAWLAVSRDLVPEVDALVVLGSFPASAQGYLSAGERGPGRVSSDVLRLLAPVAARYGFDFDPDAPAFAEMLGDAGGPARIMDVPLPADVAGLSVISASDLPLLPAGWRLPVTYNACPIWEGHPWLPTSGEVAGQVNRFLDGDRPPPCRPWAQWAATAAKPFGVPPR